MLKKSGFLTIIATVCILVLGSCKKGDTGPAGPAGPAGPTGPEGPAGPAGSANVIYSGWLDVAFTEEDVDQDGTNDGFFGVIDAPKLTSTIVNTGVVKVYCNVGTVN